MRRILYMITIALLMVTGCDVHEWPETPETVPFHLKLDYKTDMTMWPHYYNRENMIELGTGPVTASVRPYGTMRYVIRAYPFHKSEGILENYTHEFILLKDIADGYNNELTINLPPGSYSIMVWSDMQKYSSQPYFYNCSNFGEIALTGEYQGNNNWRDAFSGKGNIHLAADILENIPDTLSISMERPLAKYEFITTDIVEFIEEETNRSDTKVDLNDITIEFRYVGFMPSAYSLHTGKPVDSFTGVVFNSRLKSLSDTTASIGFDYVFTNNNTSAVTLQVVIYNKDGICISASEPIKVPLKRSYCTTVWGIFLTGEAKGGVAIYPQYDGNYNMIFP